MPDNRFFHKRAGHSVKVNRLSDFDELAWRYYIESADDFGVMPFTAISLQHDHERMAAKPARIVQRALEHVRDVELIYTFEHQGRTFCFQQDWQEWQKVTYPRVTLYPKPPADVLTACTRLTQQLFTAHPGGWKLSRKIPEVFLESSGNLPEKIPKSSREITGKPLAVSRKPLATSHQPLAVHAAPADARSRHPVFRCDRFVVFDWQLDDLRQLLGPHFETFALDEWFYTLAARADAERLMISKNDVKKWIYDATVEEAERRGLRSPSSALRPEDLVLAPGDER